MADVHSGDRQSNKVKTLPHFRPHKLFHILILVSISFAVLLATIPVLAATFLLSASSGTPGTSIDFSGGSFTANSTFRVHFAYSTLYESIVTSGIVGVNGTVAGSFPVPQIPGGNYTILVETTANDSVTVPFALTPSITISTGSIRVGDTLTVTGKGFGASRTVNIQFDGVNTASTTSDINGVFSTTFNIPPSQAGTHTVAVDDGLNGQSTGLTVVSAITVNPGMARVGDTVTVTGKGFGASRTVTVQFDGVTVISPMSDGTGSFSASFNVPACQSGSHAVAASDGINSHSILVTVLLSMTVTPTTVHVGDPVAITGSGFGNSRTVTIQFDGTTVATTTSDANGSFSTTFNVPASGAGIHTVTANDGTNSLASVVTLTMSLTVSPTSVRVGEVITISGKGFGVSRTIDIRLDGITVASTASDTGGSFSTSFNLTPNPAGPH